MPMSRQGLAAWLGVIAAIAVPLLLFAMGRDSKKLTYEVVGPFSVINVEMDDMEQLEITFRGEPVLDPVAFAVRFWNSGDLPIEPRDFERRIELGFSDDAVLMSGTVARREPSDLSPQLAVDGSSILIEPLLLNPGDEFSIVACLSEAVGRPNVGARISGIREIEEHRIERYFAIALGGLGGTGVLGTLTYFYLMGIATSLLFARSVASSFRRLGVELAIAGFALAMASGFAIIRVVDLFDLSSGMQKLALAATLLACSPIAFLGMRRGRELLQSSEVELPLDGGSSGEEHSEAALPN